MSEQKNWYNTDRSDNNSNNGYNGNNGYAADPEGTNRRFAGASFGFGIASLALLWTGVFSMITGAIGTLFGVLSRRKGKGYPRKGKAGFTMSMIGMFAGLFLTVYSLFVVFATVSPKELYQQMEDTYEQMYGEEFDPSEYGIDSSLYDYDSFLDYLEHNAENEISR